MLPAAGSQEVRFFVHTTLKNLLSIIFVISQMPPCVPRCMCKSCQIDSKCFRIIGVLILWCDKPSSELSRCLYDKRNKFALNLLLVFYIVFVTLFKPNNQLYKTFCSCVLPTLAYMHDEVVSLDGSYHIVANKAH